MARRIFFSLAILAVMQFSLGVVLSSPSLAQQWAVKGKQQGTLKVVDLFWPGDSVLENYGETLVALDKDNNEVAGLAEDWRWIDDRTIEFKLRQAVKFHNGERFNAEAVKVNWQMHKRMECPTTFRYVVLPYETKSRTNGYWSRRSL